MARAWSQKEIEFYYKELTELYVKQNKTIAEIGKILSIGEQTVYQRMQKLGIKSTPHLKKNYLNKRNDIVIPDEYSEELAEFIGIMLGDGSLTHFQVIVTLGNKELVYAQYVQKLMQKVFKVRAKICTRATGYRDVYIGSVVVSAYLLNMGFSHNKTKSQVDVPEWIMLKPEYMRACIRGFFDTDGSMYKLKFGNQISLCNSSRPLLQSLQSMLLRLEYKPSSISLNNVYLTRRQDLKRFLQKIGSNHPKKLMRLKKAIASVG